MAEQEMKEEPWRDIAARKRAEQYARIPEAWRLPQSTDHEKSNILQVPRQSGILTDVELQITEKYDATDLIDELAKGNLTSEAVTTAFCKRAAIAQQLTNCLTEVLFDDAIARAKELDAHFNRTGQTFGPLHGLPISLKDTFQIRGYDASLGVAALCFKPSTVNSTLAEHLLSLGAVLYCKTNVPQTMMALDSHNNIFGRVRNPAHKDLTPGGSSGGEGALICLHGSPLGVGTDVGGSIRIPALCNGLYGIKPSHGRVPYANQQGGLPAGSSKISIEATAGPIAHSIRDCEMLLRVVGDNQPWLFDPDVIPQSWQQQPGIHARLPPPGPRRKNPLRIGIVRTDGHVTPLPPVQRMIDEVAKTLRSHSQSSMHITPIEVVDLDISSLLSRCIKTANGLFSLDGTNSWFDILESTSEPLSPWLQTRLSRRPRKTTEQVTKLQGEKLELQTRTLDIWRESGGFWDASAQKQQISSNVDREIDVFICPAAPHPIPPTDRWNDVNYTAAFNLLDLPAGIIPVRAVSKEDLACELQAGEPLNGWDKINRELWGQKERELYAGSVLSVQVVAPKLQERRLVESMAVIDEALKRGKRIGGKKSSLL
jgi:amidase